MTLIASRRRGEILSAYRTRRTVSAEIRVVDKQQAAGSSGAGAGCSSAEMTHSVLLLLSATLLVSATAAAPAITVYSHPRCHYCQDVKAMLKDKAMAYTEKILETDGEGPIWSEMQRRAMTCCKMKVTATRVNGMDNVDQLLTIMPQVFLGKGSDSWYGRPGIRAPGDLDHLARVVDSKFAAGAYRVDAAAADHTAKAVELDAAEDYESALVSFKAAAEFAPSSSVWFNLGSVLVDPEYPGKALQLALREGKRAFEKALKLDAGNGAARKALAALAQEREL